MRSTKSVAGIAFLFVFCASSVTSVSLAGDVAVDEMVSTGSGSTAPESAAPVSEAAKEDKAWSEEMDKKIDTTIEILNVIKKEIQDAKKDAEVSEKAKPAAMVSEEESIEKVADTAGRAAKVWNKVSKIVREKTDPGTDKGAASLPAVDDQWEKNVSKKLDKGIETMGAIKKALEKMDKEDSSGTAQPDKTGTAEPDKTK